MGCWWWEKVAAPPLLWRRTRTGSAFSSPTIWTSTVMDLSSSRILVRDTVEGERREMVMYRSLEKSFNPFDVSGEMCGAGITFWYSWKGRARGGCWGTIRRRGRLMCCSPVWLSLMVFSYPKIKLSFSSLRLQTAGETLLLFFFSWVSRLPSPSEGVSSWAHFSSFGWASQSSFSWTSYFTLEGFFFLLVDIFVFSSMLCLLFIALLVLFFLPLLLLLSFFMSSFLLIFLPSHYCCCPCWISDFSSSYWISSSCPCLLPLLGFFL